MPLVTSRALNPQMRIPVPMARTIQAGGTLPQQTIQAIHTMGGMMRNSANTGKETPFTPAFLAVKLFDIGLTTMYFFVFGLIAAKLMDKVLDMFHGEDYEKVPLWQLFLEIIFQLIFIGVVGYSLRNLVSLIPFPLNGVAGFDHSRLKELEGGEVLVVVFILFQRNLYDKVVYFANKVLGITKTEGENIKGAIKGSIKGKK
jgi:hypothetical protein